MAHVGLYAIEGQDDAALRLGDASETIGVLEREAEQCIVALQEIGARALGHGDAPLDQGVMDVRDTAVVGLAVVAHPGDDIEATLGRGQGQAAFGFRPIGCAHLGTARGETAANLQREM
jgi:hypothetical protein